MRVAKGKSTEAEVAARVDTVMTLLLRGAPRTEIVQYASKTWAVSTRTADEYTAKANEQIKGIIQPRKEYEYALLRTRLEDLYAKTLKIQDYYTALRVLKQIGDLTGVNAPKQVEIIDWREEMRRAGASESEINKVFQQMVDEAAERLAAHAQP